MKKVKVTPKQFRNFVRKTISELVKDKVDPYKKMSDEELVGLFVKRQMKEVTDAGGLAIKDASLVPPSPAAVADDSGNVTIDGGALEDEGNTEEIDLSESMIVVESIIKEMNDKTLTFEKCIKIAENIGKSIPKKYYLALKSTFEKKMAGVIKESSFKDEFERLVF